jgi:hypothetical protein
LVLLKQDGTVAALALLTKDQHDTIVMFEDLGRRLVDERDRLVKEGHHAHSYQRDEDDEPDNNDRTVEQVSKELARLSTKMSKLYHDLDLQVDALIDDLEVILGSAILKPWIATRVPHVNTIAEKVAALNAMKPGSVYKGKRIRATKSKPARYWLDENYVEENRKNKRLVSFVTTEYALIGIKGNWVLKKRGKHFVFSKRDTLKQALEYEERHGVIVIPRRERDALPLKMIASRLVRP